MILFFQDRSYKIITIETPENSEGNLQSISPTLYEQLLQGQLPKVLKTVKCLFAILGSASVKADQNVGEIDPCSQFHQHFTSSFCTNIILLKL